MEACCCEVYYETSIKTYGIVDTVDCKRLNQVFFPRTYTVWATDLHQSFHGPTPFLPRTFTRLPCNYTLFPRTYTGQRSSNSEAGRHEERFREPVTAKGCLKLTSVWPSVVESGAAQV